MDKSRYKASPSEGFVDAFLTLKGCKSRELHKDQAYPTYIRCVRDTKIMHNASVGGAPNQFGTHYDDRINAQYPCTNYPKLWGLDDPLTPSLRRKIAPGMQNPSLMYKVR